MRLSLLILLTRNVDLKTMSRGTSAAFCSACHLSRVDHVGPYISKSNLGIKPYFIVIVHHYLKRINHTMYNGPDKNPLLMLFVFKNIESYQKHLLKNYKINIFKLTN